MLGVKHLNQVFNSSEEIFYDESSKFVIMSDCHRGVGSWGDNFSNNQNLFFAALNHYYYNNFTYIELGDGDELWENRKLDKIITMHSDVYWMLSKFYEGKRLYMLYGNHDMVKKNFNYVSSKYNTYYDESAKKRMPLFPNIKIHEGLILKHKDENRKIFLTHGHQVDFLNYNLWVLARFLVRYLWSPLELAGFHDPTSAAQNHEKKDFIEKKLSNWAFKKHQMLIAGHTHRPVFPKVGEPLYFNDGSCVHPRCITALEIENGAISLVKWAIKTKKNGALYVGRIELEGPVPLQDFYTN
jgi:UDP-2,3-diacylglucosamine pyrophosphatase LpxH